LDNQQEREQSEFRFFSEEARKFRDELLSFEIDNRSLFDVIRRLQEVIKQNELALAGYMGKRIKLHEEISKILEDPSFMGLRVRDAVLDYMHATERAFILMRWMLTKSFEAILEVLSVYDQYEDILKSINADYLNVMPKNYSAFFDVKSFKEKKIEEENKKIISLIMRYKDVKENPKLSPTEKDIQLNKIKWDLLRIPSQEVVRKIFMEEIGEAL